METEIVEKNLAPTVDKILSIQVVDQTTMADAVEMLSKINKLKDLMAEEKEKVTKPMNAALKAERARWKPREEACDRAIEHLRSQLSAYQTAQKKDESFSQMDLAQNILDGKMDIDTALDKLDVTPDGVDTLSGRVRFRETQTLKITDELAIPREYLVVNEKKVLEDLKAGKVVTGAEIELIQVPINYR